MSEIIPSAPTLGGSSLAPPNPTVPRFTEPSAELAHRLGMSQHDLLELVTLTISQAHRSTGGIEKLLTVEQAAEAFQVKERVVHDWIKSGALGFFRTGNGVIRIPQACVRERIERCTVKAWGGHGRPMDKA